MTKQLVSYQRARFDDYGWVIGFGWEVSLSVEPRDIWIGLYWTRTTMNILDLYICLLPCLPIRLSLWGVA